MKKKVLILSRNQFGYLIDTLKYCEYAADCFDITYLCWDYQRPRIELPDINVKYISRASNIITRNFRLLYLFNKEIKNGYDIIFANYFIGISLIKSLNSREQFVLDVRTLCVSLSKIRRLLLDSLLKFEVLFFNNVSVVTDGVAKKLNLKNYYILPLGGECFTNRPKSFKKLSLLYIGTLYNRNIIECVKGFHLYLKSLTSKELSTTLTIVGDSPYNELEQIKSYITENNLEKHIYTTGYIENNRLHTFFEEANVGISYVPLTTYYDFQPPTKTYEYLISGIPVIATATFENKELVTGKSGVIINDNATSFFYGIKDIYLKRHSFKSDEIKRYYSQHTWSSIVKSKFIPFINALTNHKHMIEKSMIEESSILNNSVP